MITTRRAAGIAAAAIGIVLVFAGMPASADEGSNSASIVSTQSVPLHNITAAVGTDCPAGGAAYWHFIIAPNNGSFAFVSITLNLGLAQNYTASGAGIIPNGVQTDNVFVAVPAGSALDDIVSGSAVISPPGGEPQFNLSHLCEGAVPEVTTTTAAATTTTAAQTTTTAAATTTTTAAATTTTSLLGSGAQSPTTTAAALSGTLPNTGGATGSMLAVGGFMILLGVATMLVNRRLPA